MDQRNLCFPVSFRRVVNKREELSHWVKADTPMAEKERYCGEVRRKPGEGLGPAVTVIALHLVHRWTLSHCAVLAGQGILFNLLDILFILIAENLLSSHCGSPFVA